MTLSLNTLLLARQLIGQQSMSVNASREEIGAVLDARDEIDAAIAELQPAEPTNGNRAARRHPAKATSS